MFEQRARLMSVALQLGETGELVHRPGEVLRVPRSLERRTRRLELAPCAVDVSFTEHHVAAREVRSSAFRLQSQGAVRILRALQRRGRVVDPSRREVLAHDVHVHLSGALGIGGPRLEELELSSRLGGLRHQPGIDVRIDEARVDARDCVGIAETRSLDLVEEALEQEDRVPHIAERAETDRLPVDGVDAGGRWLVAEELLGTLVTLERLVGASAALEPQPTQLLGLCLDAGQAVAAGVATDVLERAFGLLEAAVGDGDARLVQTHPKRGLEAGRPPRDQLVRVDSELRREVLERFTRRPSPPGLDGADVRVRVAGLPDLALRKAARLA